MAQFVDGRHPGARPIRSSPNSRRNSVSSFPGIGMGTDSLEIADTKKENGPPHPPTAPTRSSRHNVSSSPVGLNTNQCHAPQPRQFQSNAQQADHHGALLTPTVTDRLMSRARRKLQCNRFLICQEMCNRACKAGVLLSLVQVRLVLHLWLRTLLGWTCLPFKATNPFQSMTLPEPLIRDSSG